MQLVEYVCPKCGGTFITRLQTYKKSPTKMCRSCAAREAHKTHGLSNHPLLRTWCSIKTRCTNSNHKSYHDYGERGISVCPEWMNNFSAFIAWAEQSGWYEGCGLSLDRIDNDGNYTPENCRWATWLEQNHNKRMNRNNTSGYTGVDRYLKGWRWQLQTLGKKFVRSGFATPEEAVAARNQFIKENGLPHALQEA